MRAARAELLAVVAPWMWASITATHAPACLFLNAACVALNATAASFCLSEFYDGSNLNRYLNQTDGSVVGNPASSEHPWLRSAVSTADTALASVVSR